MPRQTQQRLRPQQHAGVDTPIIDPRLVDDLASRRDTLYSTDSMEETQYEGARPSYAGAAAASPGDGDNSSNHEREDDIFSDRSPRSSMGSMSSEADHHHHRHHHHHHSPHDKTRSPRVSDDVHQAFEAGDVAYLSSASATASANKGNNPRPTLHSPSSGKATTMTTTMQLSSPASSVTGTPRSSGGGRRSAIPTMSRIGSPSLSTQYSPKKTPPRFKRSTPPLVLLHVTLLPLRWAWGHVLNHAQPGELSDEAKTLREAWRQLQDRNGDTIQDRGILLPHPQNDFELLEERLLEALELPLKRRARILECGHYLGPSNVTSFSEEDEEEDEVQAADEDENQDMGSGDEDDNDDIDDDDGDDNGTAKSRRTSVQKQTHWCATCASDIRYDALGPGKVYRVNVYASNGLLKAGAWAACWKEMERVDVELEPIIDPKLQDELARLVAGQDKTADNSDRAHLHRRYQGLGGEQAPSGKSFVGPDNKREEERWRDMYGHGTSRASTGFVAPRAEPGASVFKTTAALPGIIRASLGSLLRNRRNMAIILLGVLTALVAVRSGSHEGGGVSFQKFFSSASPHPPQLIRAGEGAVTDECTARSTFTLAQLGWKWRDDPCAAANVDSETQEETEGGHSVSSEGDDDDDDDDDDAEEEEEEEEDEEEEEAERDS